MNWKDAGKPGFFEAPPKMVNENQKRVFGSRNRTTHWDKPKRGVRTNRGDRDLGQQRPSRFEPVQKQLRQPPRRNSWANSKVGNTGSFRARNSFSTENLHAPIPESRVEERPNPYHAVNPSYRPALTENYGPACLHQANPKIGAEPSAETTIARGLLRETATMPAERINSVDMPFKRGRNEITRNFSYTLPPTYEDRENRSAFSSTTSELHIQRPKNFKSRFGPALPVPKHHLLISTENAIGSNLISARNGSLDNNSKGWKDEAPLGAEDAALQPNARRARRLTAVEELLYVDDSEEIPAVVAEKETTEERTTQNPTYSTIKTKLEWGKGLSSKNKLKAPKPEAKPSSFPVSRFSEMPKELQKPHHLSQRSLQPAVKIPDLQKQQDLSRKEEAKHPESSQASATEVRQIVKEESDRVSLPVDVEEALPLKSIGIEAKREEAANNSLLAKENLVKVRSLLCRGLKLLSSQHAIESSESFHGNGVVGVAQLQQSILEQTNRIGIGAALASPVLQRHGSQKDQKTLKIFSDLQSLRTDQKISPSLIKDKIQQALMNLVEEKQVEADSQQGPLLDKAPEKDLQEVFVKTLMERNQVSHPKMTRSLSYGELSVNKGSDTQILNGLKDGEDGEPDVLSEKHADTERRVINAAILPRFVDPLKEPPHFVRNMAYLTTDLQRSRCLHSSSKCCMSVKELARFVVVTNAPVRLPLHKTKGMLGRNCNCALRLWENWSRNRRFSDLEKVLFIDKFLQFPKRFKKIAASFRNKSTGDVIGFYYATKYVVNYKELLREQFHRRKVLGYPTWELVVKAALKLGVKFSAASSPGVDSLPLLERLHNREIVLGKVAGYSKIKEYRTEYSPPLVYPEETEIVTYALGQCETKEDRLRKIHELLPWENVRLYRYINDISFSIPKVRARVEKILETAETAETAVKADNKLSQVEEKQQLLPGSLILPGNGRNKWSEEEKLVFISEFKKHGKQWKKIASFVPNKTVAQVRNYYQNYKNRLSLDKFLPQSGSELTGSASQDNIQQSLSVAQHQELEQELEQEQEQVPQGQEVQEQGQEDLSLESKRRVSKAKRRNSKRRRLTGSKSKHALSEKSLDPEELEEAKMMYSKESREHSKPLSSVSEGWSGAVDAACSVQQSDGETARLVSETRTLSSELAQASQAVSHLTEEQQNMLSQTRLGNEYGENVSTVTNAELELELIRSVRRVFEEIRKKVDVAQVAYATQLSSLTEAYVSLAMTQGHNSSPQAARTHYERFQLGVLDLQNMIKETKEQLVSEYNNAKQTVLQTLLDSGAQTLVVQVFDTEDRVTRARFNRLTASITFLHFQAMQQVQRFYEMK